MPQDVKLSPDGQIFYVADMHANGLWEVDGGRLQGARLPPDRRGRARPLPEPRRSYLYVTNRSEGSISVVGFRTAQGRREVADPGGGSPDMGGVSADGKVLWLSGRYNASRVRDLDPQRAAARADPRRRRARTGCASGRSPAATRSATPASSASWPTGAWSAPSTGRRKLGLVVAAVVRRARPWSPPRGREPDADRPREPGARRGSRGAGARVAARAIAPILREAVVATEDERYYRHHGIDLIGVARALPYDLVHLSLAQGASTITEQVAKLLYLGGNDHTPWRKLEDAARRPQAREPLQEGADPRRVPEQRVLRRGRLRRLRRRASATSASRRAA